MQGRQREVSKAHKVSALTELLSNAEKDMVIFLCWRVILEKGVAKRPGSCRDKSLIELKLGTNTRATSSAKDSLRAVGKSHSASFQ